LCAVSGVEVPQDFKFKGDGVGRLHIYDNPSSLADRALPGSLADSPSVLRNRRTRSIVFTSSQSMAQTHLSCTYQVPCFRGTLSVTTFHSLNSLDHDRIKSPSSSFLHLSSPPSPPTIIRRFSYPTPVLMALSATRASFHPVWNPSNGWPVAVRRSPNRCTAMPEIRSVPFIHIHTLTLRGRIFHILLLVLWVFPNTHMYLVA